jgi:hypothetical protein
VAVGLETARDEWSDGARQVEAAKEDPVHYQRLVAQVEVVTAELRRRVGQTFSLGELCRVYDDADRWARDVVEEQAPSPGWPRDLATVAAAAFHAYQRGATDYVP